MKIERPILFSTAMVQALLAGRKTQTRRIMKPQPSSRATEIFHCTKGGWPKTPWHARLELPADPGYYEVTDLYKCPYGEVGDILWAKESFWQYGRWVKTDDPKMKNGKEWHPLASEPIRFVADNPTIEPAKGLEWSMGYRWRKMSSLFLKKEHARIWMEETDLRVERVQDISEADAIYEGALQVTKDGKLMKYCIYGHGDYSSPPWQDMPYTAKACFGDLWTKINGPESFKANPWTWAVSFTLLSTTGKPDNK